jgi:hypothetical protein
MFNLEFNKKFTGKQDRNPFNRSAINVADLFRLWYFYCI